MKALKIKHIIPDFAGTSAPQMLKSMNPDGDLSPLKVMNQYCRNPKKALL